MNSSKKEHAPKSAKPASSYFKYVWACSAYLSLPHPCANLSCNRGQRLKLQISAPNPASISQGQQAKAASPLSLPLPALRCQNTAKAARETCSFSPKTATCLQSKGENTSRIAANNSCPKICSWSNIPSFAYIAPTPAILQGEDAK